MCYLDAAGVVLYLPAYLTLALDDVGKHRLWVLDLLDTSLGGDDAEYRAHLEGRLSLLNDAQRRTSAHVLSILRSELSDGVSTQFERERIDRILEDPYWRTHRR